MQINFFGDFVAPETDTLVLSPQVHNLLEQGDINVVHFESVAILPTDYHPIVKSGPNIFQDEKAPSFLEGQGFSVVSMANNHAMDYGKDALVSTISAFQKSAVCGAGEWAKAYEPCIIKLGGKTIGFIAASHCEFGTLTENGGDVGEVGYAWINNPYIDTLVERTRKEVDFLFVFAHAGVEHLSQPLPEWRDRYRSFIDLGCDGVIASHPHIVQGWEIYKGKPILYSLGNFYFPKQGQISSHWHRSICASIKISEDGDISFQITPLHFRQGSIEVDTSNDFQQYLAQTNNILNNPERYMTFMNKSSVDALEIFYAMFLNGGMARCYSIKKIIRIIWHYIRNNNTPRHNSAWFYNAFRCESHRWFFERGMRLKNNYV